MTGHNIRTQRVVNIHEHQYVDNHNEIPVINSCTTGKFEGKLSDNNSIASSVDCHHYTKKNVVSSSYQQRNDRNLCPPAKHRFTCKNIEVASVVDKTRESHERVNKRNIANYVDCKPKNLSSSSQRIDECLNSNDRRREKQESSKLIDKLIGRTVTRYNVDQQRQVFESRFRGISEQVGRLYSTQTKNPRIRHSDNVKNVYTRLETRDAVNGERRKVSIPYSLMRYKAKPDWSYVYKSNHIQRYFSLRNLILTKLE
jgi:hypothetical protein